LLLFTLGARVSEAANIRLGDFVQERKHLVVTLHGKGDKPRVLPVPPHVVDALERYCWLDQRYDQNLSLDQAGQLTPDAPLFKPERGGGHNGARGRDRCISSTTLWRIVVRHSARAGYQVTTHTLRHTAATKALEKTKDVARVAAMLGHSDIKTTMRYL
jgi:integrase/recombinase XerD